MKQMTRPFEYKGYNFITTVDFNTRSERSIYGKTYHTVTTMCVDGPNYLELMYPYLTLKDDVTTDMLEYFINDHIYRLTQHIDGIKTPKSPVEILLSNLGFT